MKPERTQIPGYATAGVFAVIVATAAAAGQGRPLPAEVRTYLNLSATYSRGQAHDAVAALRQRDPATLERTVAAVQSSLKGRVYLCPTAAKGEVALSLIDAAVLLHTDAALGALAESRGDEMWAHLRCADRLLAWTRDGRALLAVGGPSGTCGAPAPLAERDWLLAVSLLTLRGWALGAAVTYADRLHAVAPTDSDALFASGAVAEAAAASAESPRTDARSSMGQYFRLRQEALTRARQLRETAATLYRQALEPSPERHAIRVRLGRVLAQLGRSRDARRELQRAAEQSGSRVEEYLAALFLGRVLADDGETAAAVSWFERATTSYEDGHAARLALAQALDASGRDAEAERAILRAVENTRASTVDPWVAYLLGPWQIGEATLQRLRAAVVR